MATPQDNFRFLNFLKANTPITGWWMAATGQIGAVSSAVIVPTAMIDATQILWINSQSLEDASAGCALQTHTLEIKV